MDKLEELAAWCVVAFCLACAAVVAKSNRAPRTFNFSFYGTKRISLFLESIVVFFIFLAIGNGVIDSFQSNKSSMNPNGFQSTWYLEALFFIFPIVFTLACFNPKAKRRD